MHNEFVQHFEIFVIIAYLLFSKPYSIMFLYVYISDSGELYIYIEKYLKKTPSKQLKV